MTVYGLPNCDSTKAALKWLKRHDIQYDFHDYKLKGIMPAHINKWLDKIPLEKLLNKKSTTWRGLPAIEQENASTHEGAVALMTLHASLIKRPLIEWPDKQITAGFDEALFAKMI
jgi:Spx/MgsR family transcriptional regulator